MPMLGGRGGMGWLRCVVALAWQDRRARAEHAGAPQAATRESAAAAWRGGYVERLVRTLLVHALERSQHRGGTQH
jgi:hypothetical protein